MAVLSPEVGKVRKSERRKEFGISKDKKSPCVIAGALYLRGTRKLRKFWGTSSGRVVPTNAPCHCERSAAIANFALPLCITALNSSRLPRSFLTRNDKVYFPPKYPIIALACLVFTTSISSSSVAARTFFTDLKYLRSFSAVVLPMRDSPSMTTNFPVVGPYSSCTLDDRGFSAALICPIPKSPPVRPIRQQRI